MSNHYDYMPKGDGWVPQPYPMEPAQPDISENSEPEKKHEDTVVSPEPAKPETNGESGKQSDPDSSAHSAFEDNTPAEKAISLCSNILSWLFVPLMMPVYGIILIFTLSILSLAPTSTKVFFTLVVFGTTFLFPMAMVILLKKMGIIEDIGLNGRKERLIPYIITIVCMAGTGWFLWYKGAPLWVAMFFAGGALAGLINMIVNFRWKISAHAAGIAGIVAMLIQITKEGFPMPGMTWWIVGSILLAGLLCSARVWLGRHTLPQVLAGTAVGFLCVWSLSLL